MTRKLFSFFAVTLFVCQAAAQQKPTAFINARIIPIVGQPIEQGVLIVQNGKIKAVGDARTVRLSSDVQAVDLQGKTIMPGLIDSHSHIGEGAGADGSAPIQPDVRLLDALNPRAGSLQRAQAGGITTGNVMPGSGHLDSGQTLYLKLRDNVNKVEDLLIYDQAGKYMGGIKFANGTNPLRTTPPFPGTRSKAAAMVREQFTRAQEYRDKVRKAGSDKSKLRARAFERRAVRVAHIHRFELAARTVDQNNRRRDFRARDFVGDFPRLGNVLQDDFEPELFLQTQNSQNVVVAMRVKMNGAFVVQNFDERFHS